ncbi:MAG: hypothetical protein ACU843_11575 [Gammaproteobacteria bacterium]
MLDRAALIVRYKQPFVDWINGVGPPEEDLVTLSYVNEDNSVYLIELADPEEFDEWLELNYEELFEEELSEWTMDTSLWPPDRSLERFMEWCGFDLHTVVIDLGESPLEEDED